MENFQLKIVGQFTTDHADIVINGLQEELENLLTDTIKKWVDLKSLSIGVIKGDAPAYMVSFLDKEYEDITVTLFTGENSLSDALKDYEETNCSIDTESAALSLIINRTNNFGGHE